MHFGVPWSSSWGHCVLILAATSHVFSCRALRAGAVAGHNRSVSHLVPRAAGACGGRFGGKWLRGDAGASAARASCRLYNGRWGLVSGSANQSFLSIEVFHQSSIRLNSFSLHFRRAGFLLTRRAIKSELLCKISFEAHKSKASRKLSAS